MTDTPCTHHPQRDQRGYCVDCGAFTGEPGDRSRLSPRELAKLEWSLVCLHIGSISRIPFPKGSKRWRECWAECRRDAGPHLEAWAAIRRIEKRITEQMRAA